MQKSRAAGIGFGAAFVAIGLLIYFGVRLSPDGASAPIWVIEAAAGAFFFAGVSQIAQTLNAPMLARLCGLVVVYLLAVPGLWMLFGGDGQCSVSHAIGATSFSGDADPLTCRLVFGGGAIVVLGFALLMTWVTLRKLRGPTGSNPATRSEEVDHG